MKIVNMHEAKTNFSKLAEQVATHGESFIVARAGKPFVKVVPLGEGDQPSRRIGFLEGRFKVPDDFKDMGREMIEAMFDGEA